MSTVATWRLFAFMDKDETGATDERRTIADWQLHDTLRWCTSRGYDHIYLARDPDQRTTYQPGEPLAEVTHSWEESSGDQESAPTEPERPVAGHRTLCD